MSPDAKCIKTLGYVESPDEACIRLTFNAPSDNKKFITKLDNIQFSYRQLEVWLYENCHDF
jgi:hypothetical protein